MLLLSFIEVSMREGNTMLAMSHQFLVKQILRVIMIKGLNSLYKDTNICKLIGPVVVKQR